VGYGAKRPDVPRTPGRSGRTKPSNVFDVGSESLRSTFRHHSWPALAADKDCVRAQPFVKCRSREDAWTAAAAAAAFVCFRDERTYKGGNCASHGLTHVRRSKTQLRIRETQVVSHENAGCVARKHTSVLPKRRCVAQETQVRRARDAVSPSPRHTCAEPATHRCQAPTQCRRAKTQVRQGNPQVCRARNTAARPPRGVSSNTRHACVSPGAVRRH
jgi:hypothetical protein